MSDKPSGHQLRIGALIFPGVDVMDVVGPFEVLSRLSGATFKLIWKDRQPLRDYHGFKMVAGKEIKGCPQLDVLVVPGGFGQTKWMEDRDILDFIRAQSAGARYTLSVCTGALLCGAAGLLQGKNATTHWASFELLELYGAKPLRERFVIDGTLITCAGVSAGIDGALKLAALLEGDVAAQRIQLAMEYAPAPPFNAGSPDDAPPEVLEAATRELAEITNQRRASAEAFSTAASRQPQAID